MIGSPSYKLAKKLARILTPLTGNTPHAVKNSASFVDIIRKTQLHPEDRLISFDVSNLFTQVPIEEALRVVTEKLSMDESLKDGTSIPTSHLVQLIELCLRTTYFQFEDKFYEQSEGAAMGSPLSPVIANLYMEHLEETALQTATLHHRLWLRYVDDTFVIWQHGPEELQRFHEHINRQHPNITFTIEQEKEGKLACLDHMVNMATKIYLNSMRSLPHGLGLRYFPHCSPRELRTIVVYVSFQTAAALSNSSAL